MEIWNRARSFAEEAAKRSQELTIGTSKLGDIVTEASKRADQIRSEAVKRADQIRSEAVKRADQIIKSSSTATTTAAASTATMELEEEKDLERFGITEELRDFVNEITINTFEDFPLEDDSEMANVPSVSNVSQDLTDWQAKHASLVLKTVKEIAKLRYELCPRIMKERKFWRIYFILVNNHVSPYEKWYMEGIKPKSEGAKDDKAKESSNVKTTSTAEAVESKPQKTTSTPTFAEQDLDAFLLGEDGDDGADGVDGGALDDDFDKFMDSSDDEKDK